MQCRPVIMKKTSSGDGKRVLEMTSAAVQEGNRQWWTAHTMSYDWKSPIEKKRWEQEWFDEIDTRFIAASRYFAHDRQPFDRVIPFDAIRGKRVLEIGCGMGLHTELMLRAGAQVCSIDLSPTSVMATRRRLELKGLPCDVSEVDAESLPFVDQSFDFVWSWGVMHHSARTGRIVREIARVLRPDGACRVMVYNREGIAAKIAFWRDHVFKGAFFRQSFDETLFRTSDGFSARFYVTEQFEDLFRTFFRTVSAQIVGQESDVIPLPRQLRWIVRPLFTDSYSRRAQARRGAFIFLAASFPE